MSRSNARRSKVRKPKVRRSKVRRSKVRRSKRKYGKYGKYLKKIGFEVLGTGALVATVYYLSKQNKKPQAPRAPPLGKVDYFEIWLDVIGFDFFSIIDKKILEIIAHDDKGNPIPGVIEKHKKLTDKLKNNTANENDINIYLNYLVDLKKSSEFENMTPEYKKSISYILKKCEISS
jgi:hypothetical protein